MKHPSHCRLHCSPSIRYPSLWAECWAPPPSAAAAPSPLPLPFPSQPVMQHWRGGGSDPRPVGREMLLFPPPCRGFPAGMPLLGKGGFSCLSTFCSPLRCRSPRSLSHETTEPHSTETPSWPRTPKPHFLSSFTTVFLLPNQARPKGS